MRFSRRKITVNVYPTYFGGFNFEAVSSGRNVVIGPTCRFDLALEDAVVQGTRAALRIAGDDEIHIKRWKSHRDYIASYIR